MSSALVSRYYETGNNNPTTTTAGIPSTISEECSSLEHPVAAERRGSFGPFVSFPSRVMTARKLASGPPSIKSVSSRESGCTDHNTGGTGTGGVICSSPAMSFSTRFSRRGSNGSNKSSEFYDCEKRRGSIGPLSSFQPRFNRRGSSTPDSPAITEDSDTYEFQQQQQQPPKSSSFKPTKKGTVLIGIPLAPQLNLTEAEKEVISSDSHYEQHGKQATTRKANVGFHEDSSVPPPRPINGTDLPPQWEESDSNPYEYKTPAAAAASRRGSLGSKVSQFARRRSADFAAAATATRRKSVDSAVVVTAPPPPVPREILPAANEWKSSMTGWTSARSGFSGLSEEDSDTREHERTTKTTTARRGSIGSVVAQFARRTSLTTSGNNRPVPGEINPPRRNRRASADMASVTSGWSSIDSNAYENPATRSVGFGSAVVRAVRRASGGPVEPAIPASMKSWISESSDQSSFRPVGSASPRQHNIRRRASADPAISSGIATTRRASTGLACGVPSSKYDNDCYRNEYNEKTIRGGSRRRRASRREHSGGRSPSLNKENQRQPPAGSGESVSSKTSNPYEYETGATMTRRSKRSGRSRVLVSRRGSTGGGRSPSLDQGALSGSDSASSKDSNPYEYEARARRKRTGQYLETRRGSTGGGPAPFSKTTAAQRRRRSVGPAVPSQLDPYTQPTTPKKGGPSVAAVTYGRRRSTFGGKSNRRGSADSHVSFARGSYDLIVARSANRRGSMQGSHILPPEALKNNGQPHIPVLDYRLPSANLFSLSRPAPYPSRRSPQVFLDVMLRTLGYSKECFNTLETSYYNKPTPLQIASYNEELLRIKDESELRNLMSSGISTNPCTEQGESLLHKACETGNTIAVKIMLECGASVQVSDDTGRTILHCGMSSAVPNFEIVDMILQKDLQLLQLTDRRHGTPLSYVPRDLWGPWIDYLYSRRHVYYPSRRASRALGLFLHNGGGTAPACCSPKMKEEPNSSPLPDPRGALTPELARLVASRKLTPMEAKSRLSGGSGGGGGGDNDDVATIGADARTNNNSNKKVSLHPMIGVRSSSFVRGTRFMV